MPQATVYYDGQCGLCRTAVAWMSRADWLHRVRWVAGETVARLPDGLTREMLDAAMYLEDRQGRLHGGFFALRRLATMLPPLMPIAPLMWLPGARPLGVRVYAAIARNRGCLPGRRGAEPRPPA